jgi:hypothetical protein|tara:strand:- start:1877 stop:2053 length:177 start_codon:yes stop_codon:yes gene_type:complete
MTEKIKPPGVGLAIKGIGRASNLLTLSQHDLLSAKFERDRVLLNIKDIRLKNMKKKLK